MVDSLSVRERELLDTISQAQSAENAAAARKASAIREFALLRVASLTSTGEVEPERVERKIVAEVAVACRVSPFQGRRRLHAARDLHLGLEHVRGLFAAGELAEDKVQKILAATAHLDPAERAAVDARLATEGIERLGVRRGPHPPPPPAAPGAPGEGEARGPGGGGGGRGRGRVGAPGTGGPPAPPPPPQAPPP